MTEEQLLQALREKRLEKFLPDIQSSLIRLGRNSKEINTIFQDVLGDLDFNTPRSLRIQELSQSINTDLERLKNYFSQGKL